MSNMDKVKFLWDVPLGLPISGIERKKKNPLAGYAEMVQDDEGNVYLRDLSEEEIASLRQSMVDWQDGLPEKKSPYRRPKIRLTEKHLSLLVIDTDNNESSDDNEH